MPRVKRELSFTDSTLADLDAAARWLTILNRYGRVVSCPPGLGQSSALAKHFRLWRVQSRGDHEHPRCAAPVSEIGFFLMADALSFPGAKAVPAKSPAPAASFALYSPVWLADEVPLADTTLPKGTRGVIVDRHDDRSTYDVEFNEPVQAVIALPADALSQPRPRMAAEMLGRIGRVARRRLAG